MHRSTATRWLAPATMAFAAIAVVGCAPQSGGADASSGDDTTITVAGVSILTGDPYFGAMKCGALAAAEELGVELLWDGSTSAEVGPQAQILSAMTLKEPDALVFTPFSQDAFLADVTSLMADGVPVVLADATMGEHVYLQSVQSDNVSAGETVAEYIVENAGDSGTIGLIAFGPANPIDEARYEGLADRIATGNSELRLLEPQYGEGSSSESAKVASGLIQAHPDLTVIYATNGPQATGAASAIKAAGKEGEIKLIAYAGEAEQVEALRAGSIDALLAQSPFLIGQSAVEAVVDYLIDNPGGSPVEPAAEQFIYAPTLLITKDNVDSAEAEPFLTATC